MLTREQKIDFLKCCIAAYEDERVISKMIGNELRIVYPNKDFFYVCGFCGLLNHYVSIIMGYNHIESPNMFFELKTYFSEFFISIQRQRTSFGCFFFDYNDRKDFLQRAKVARKFLKQEYGITVPKRKVLNL